jgi:hypothetical protein
MSGFQEYKLVLMKEGGEVLADWKVTNLDFDIDDLDAMENREFYLYIGQEVARKMAAYEELLV